MAKCVWRFQWWYPPFFIQKLTISVYSLLKPTVLEIPFFGNPHMFSMKHLIIGVPRYPILTYTAHMRLWLAVRPHCTKHPIWLDQQCYGKNMGVLPKIGAIETDEIPRRFLFKLIQTCGTHRASPLDRDTSRIG